MYLMDNIWLASCKKHRVSRGHNETRLSLRGIQVGCVLTLVEESWKAVNIHDLAQTEAQVSAKVLANGQWLENCLALVLNGLDPGKAAARPIMESFWQTMVLEQPIIIGDAALDLAEFMNLLQFLDRAASPQSSFIQERTALYIKPRSLPKFPPRVVRFIEILDTKIKNKVFFMAAGSGFSSGLTFGLAHEGVRPDDTICVFEGAKVPHLLRQQDLRCWTFVNEVYVYDIMHGEAEASIDDRRVESETFVLV